MKINKENWEELIKPVVVLTVICLISSALLAVTNSLTAPVIQKNKEIADNAVYTEVLPEAAGEFEDLTAQTTVSNIVAVKKARNESGWCIQATGKGFGGAVPVIIALDNEGTILNAAFLKNEESPGYGQKLVDGSADGPAFVQSLVGKADSVALHEDGVDGVTGATISSKAVINAVNSGLSAFAEVAKGAAPVEEAKFDPEAFINEALPEAEGAFEDVEPAGEKVTAVRRATNGAGYAITATGKGVVGEVPALVVVDAEGVIRKVAFLENQESPGYGEKLWDGSEEGLSFAESLVGKSGTVALHEDGVDGISEATLSSQAAVSAVNSALNGFNELRAKEAA